jgi:PKD repeat protein
LFLIRIIKLRSYFLQSSATTGKNQIININFLEMKRNVIIVMLFVFAIFSSVAQNNFVSVAGNVFGIETGLPIPNHIVTVSVESGGMNFTYDYVTDNTGYFSGDTIPASTQGLVVAETIDCNGDIIVQEQFFNPGNTFLFFDFMICSDSIFPGDCENFFWFEPAGENAFLFNGESIPVPATDYFWDFGDGQTEYGQAVVHEFDPTLGSLFTVTLTTFIFEPTTGDSCMAYSAQDVWISNTGGDCTASFTYTLDSVPGGAYIVQFNDASVGDPQFYNWDFGDGAFSDEQNPEHIYTEAGDFMVCLTIYSDSAFNCFDSYCEMIQIGNGGFDDCENLIWHNAVGDYTFEFMGDAIPFPADYFEWNFGDGNTAYGPSVVHTYDPELGDYFMVTLTTIAAVPGTVDTCVAVSSQEIWLNNNGTDCENFFWYETMDNFTFDFFGESMPLPASEYFWDFGDGNTATGPLVTHTYTGTGGTQYLITLITYLDDPIIGDSCVAISTQEIWVGNGGGNDCENWFWYESWDNMSFQFFGESYPFPADEFIWDFGDGEIAFGPLAEHTYNGAPGEVYTVTLTTLSFDPAIGDSCLAISSQEVWTGNGGGNDCENFFWYESSADYTYDFFGESFPIPADYYEWEFGDGSSGSGQFVTHTYNPSLGSNYTVCLTTYSYIPGMDSCFATSCQEIILGGQAGLEITGTVYLQDSMPADYALVGLFGMEAGGSYIYEFTTTLPGTGSYFFENVPTGDYLILAQLTPQSPNYVDYFPTYYGDALFWFDATEINLGDPENPYNINLLPISTIGQGPGIIEGLITFGDEKGGPAENISVVLMNEDELALTYVQSNSEGQFDFNDIAFGTYKLKLEIPGVPSAIATVIISEDAQSANINFIVEDDYVYLLLMDLKLEFAEVGNLYPNPTNGPAKIEIIADHPMQLNYSIINQIGQLVQQEIVNVQSGSNQVDIAASSLTQGIYTIIFINKNGNHIVRKFMKN